MDAQRHWSQRPPAGTWRSESLAAERKQPVPGHGVVGARAVRIKPLLQPNVDTTMATAMMEAPPDRTRLAAPPCDPVVGADWMAANGRADRYATLAST